MNPSQNNDFWVVDHDMITTERLDGKGIPILLMKMFANKKQERNHVNVQRLYT
jgi:hypothetical protein